MPGPLTTATIQDVFTYHAPAANQIPHYEAVRAAALEFGRVILEHTPACADQSAAIRHLREAVMTANAAIALDGLV